jgi:hypothetical protein
MRFGEEEMEVSLIRRPRKRVYEHEADGDFEV